MMSSHLRLMEQIFLPVLIAESSFHQQWDKLVAVNNGLTDFDISSFAVIPNGTGGTNLFGGGSDGGVFLSTNNGASWTDVNSGLMNTSIKALAVIGTNLFAGTNGSGIFLSSDNGTKLERGEYWFGDYLDPFSCCKRHEYFCGEL